MAFTETQRIEQEMLDLKWYHCIPVPGTNLVTPGHAEVQPSWDWTKAHLARLLLEPGSLGLTPGPRSVLDVGCRDGLFSFWFEENKFSPIEAIDSNLTGTVSWLRYRTSLVSRRPSAITFREATIADYVTAHRYTAAPAVIFCAGVLYHLRYPMRDLNYLVSLLPAHPVTGGLLILETGFYDSKTQDPLLYCPVASSPWDGTSCSFFNVTGLDETLASFGCRRVEPVQFFAPSRLNGVVRGLAVYRRVQETINTYWDSTHTDYSNRCEERSGQYVKQQVQNLLATNPPAY